MKTQFNPARRPQNNQQGSAVIVVLVLLGIIVLLVGANTKTISWLRAEVKLTDHQETARLAASATNPPPVTP